MDKDNNENYNIYLDLKIQKFVSLKIHISIFGKTEFPNIFKKSKNRKRTSFGHLPEVFKLISYFRRIGKMKNLVQAI